MAKNMISEKSVVDKGLKLECKANKFLNRCKSSIVKSGITSFTKPFFHDEFTAMGDLHAFACESSSRTHIEKDVVIPTTLVGEIFGINFWLALTIRTESHLGIDYLNLISIKLLKSASLTTNQELVSRADWDFRELIQPEFKHAQPHWHFHGRPAEKIPTDFAQFAEEGKLKDFAAYLQKENSVISGDEGSEARAKVLPPKEIDFAKIHLAMASSWHLSYEHNIVISKEQDVCCWLQNCLTYIRNQFDYLAK